MALVCWRVHMCRWEGEGTENVSGVADRGEFWQMHVYAAHPIYELIPLSLIQMIATALLSLALLLRYCIPSSLRCIHRTIWQRGGAQVPTRAGGCGLRAHRRLARAACRGFRLPG
jgi:hypothetical protein